MRQKKERITTAAEWTRKNQQIKTVELPSGAVVKVKVMSLFDLASTGHIPMSLVGEVLKSANTFLQPVDPKDVNFAWARVTEKQIEDMLTLFRKTAVAAVVEPRLSFQPVGEEAGDVTLIDFEDLAVIFRAAVKEGAIEMLPFHPKQKPGAGPRPDGAEVRTETVNDAGGEEPAAGA
ncbi:hypothetical protein LLH00_05980 [bacterium]|nr:hypothetical protein [bacterium]